jgi:molybdopterin-guanine dinucleotide biosynthesis adapter protein
MFVNKKHIITIVGKSDSGKTTLLEKLIRILSDRGYKIGTVKHAHNGFQIDLEGKDSWRHRNAGADATLLITDSTVAVVRNDISPDNDKMQKYLDGMDIILAEGFKGHPLPKIEVFRTGSGHKKPMFLSDNTLIAFVTDSDYRPKVPVFDLEEIIELADFIEQNYL